MPVSEITTPCSIASSVCVENLAKLCSGISKDKLGWVRVRPTII